ncbi:hypothetical protein LSAT2_013477 [Lamellibrachia satsuma]|nr:hypothetical protein LSAT2_013477 [Lamellibrachia satsuma]
MLLPRLLDSLVAFGLSRNNTKVVELLCQLKHELELERLEKCSKQTAFGDFFCKKHLHGNDVFAEEEAGRMLGAALASMEQLCELDLGNNDVLKKEEAGRILGAALASMEQLRELNVSRCHLSNKSRRHIVDGLSRGCSRLTSLDLGYNDVFTHEEAGRTLGAALASMEQLRELNVSWCRLSKKSLRHVLDGLSQGYHQLTSLTLEGNDVFMKDEAGRMLGAALASMEQLRELNLKWCHVTDESWRHVVDGICQGQGCHQLKQLNCQNNYLTSIISEETVRHLLTRRPHLVIK